MRREPLLGIGFLLAAVGELVRAASFYLDDLAQAALAFVAAAGLLLVSVGYLFVHEAPWATPLGLAAAVLGRVAGLALRLPDVQADLATLASVCVVLGLALAAWSARPEVLHVAPFRVGLALAAVGAVLGAAASMQAVEYVPLLGHAFALVGFALAAAVAALPEKAMPLPAA